MLWELPEFFRHSVSVEKVCWAYFRTESEALAERPAEEGLEEQEGQKKVGPLPVQKLFRQTQMLSRKS